MTFRSSTILIVRSLLQVQAPLHTTRKIGAVPSLRWGFRAALFAAIWVAPLLIRRFPPLRLHDRPARERALAAMGTSRFYIIRQMLRLLKTIVCFGYGADRNVRDAIGYPLQHDDPRRKVAP